MNYYTNRKRARTINTTPTMTDQAGARETDINVIVGQFQISGMVPGATGEPMNGDFTNLPTDLREMIELARAMPDIRKALPDKLRDMSIQDLLQLTPDKLTEILTPPADPPADQEKK